jgi:hypothetical protein|tara:strand:+ start:212 stop:499 length:288 start_codon:yes stop_codon:yes gene_type:complete
VTDQPSFPKFIRDEPGAFQAEVTMSSGGEDMVEMDYQVGDDAVMLTLIKGSEHISLDMAASDISALRETLDRCEKRLAAEQEAFRTDADWEADCA